MALNKIFISLILFSSLALASPKNQASIAPEIKKFSQVMNDIQKYYVYPESKKTLFESALQGMLSGLDPHSAYLSREEWRGLQETTKGQFAGIGLEVTMKQGLVRVITPLQGSPAKRAGIKTNDTIIRLNGKALLGLTLRMAIDQLRGPVGSTISLDIMRNGMSNPLHIVLKREMIKVQSVKSHLLTGGYGYIQLALFQTSTPSEMIAAINGLKKEAKHKYKLSLQGLLLDLRDNPGGLLDSAIAVADAFIDGKKGKHTLIVYTKGRGPWARYTAYAKQGDIIDNVPIIALINEGSASAAEIVAGALKDDHRGVLLGTRTFGKGSVQTVIPLSDGSAIRLTTALYYTPSGISIQAMGITPDITVQQITLGSADFVQNALEANNLSEADLQGHLATTTPQAKTANNNADDSDALIAQDYQLYQALNVLKGMNLTSSMSN